MLVLSRRQNEAVHIGDGIRVVIAGIRGNAVKLAIEAPRNVSIQRDEIRRQPHPAVCTAASVATQVGMPVPQVES